MGLGTLIEWALNAIGIDKTLVEKWVGAECGCNNRKERLNQLSSWAWRVSIGRTANAAGLLRTIMSQE